MSCRFNIDPGPKVEIRDIVFDGNEAVDDGDLRGQLKDNKPKSWAAVLSDSGIYQEAKFSDDAERVAEYYRTRGYAGVQIGTPQVEVLETSKDAKTRWIRVRVPVEEGPRYSIGSSRSPAPRPCGPTASGPLRHQGRRPLRLSEARKGFEKVKEVYGAYGFWQWAPEPELTPRGLDPATGAVGDRRAPPPIMDIKIRMNEGKQFFVNRISFAGNTTTHDAVIRRELRVAEGARVQYRGPQGERPPSQPARLLQAARRRGRRNGSGADAGH